MKNRFQHAIAATALLALGFAAAPAFADSAADKVTGYVEIARSVFGGDKTAGDVVSDKIAGADQGVVGELAAALSAAEVAKDDPAVADALAGIVSAVNDAAGDDAFDFASRAAATVAAVTGLDIAGSLSDEAFADAANDPDPVLDATEKADLKDLYEKVLAALKGAGYKMKEDGDKVVIDPAATGDEAGEDAGAEEEDGRAARAGEEAQDGAERGAGYGGAEAGGGEGDGGGEKSSEEHGGGVARGRGREGVEEEQGDGVEESVGGGEDRLGKARGVRAGEGGRRKGRRRGGHGARGGRGARRTTTRSTGQGGSRRRASGWTRKYRSSDQRQRARENGTRAIA